ncbi:MAG: MBL fold metallo-hydrolase [Chitinophagaceae bacterium]|nr:MAG: MBL fold metallo-hydrolase [Chitinophagaceae bacterium]
MTSIKCFVFNPFAENTYLIYNNDGDCWIIDPGCFTTQEEDLLSNYIESEGLKPSRLLLTHGHLDHVIGNDFILKKYKLAPEIHKMDLPNMESAPATAASYGVDIKPSPAPINFLKEGDVLKMGEAAFKVLFTPGHAPGHISLYNEREMYIISGDVLFENSIGRYDLPGGNLNVLLESIKNNFLNLPDEVVVYPGHGPSTTIGKERKLNPFLINID